MSNKTLEDYFASISYSSSSKNKIEIAIIDDKIRDIILKAFHIVLSKSIIYLYLNDSYPIFKYQLDRKFQMKEYTYKINDTCLVISIIGYQLKESIASFQQRKSYQLFFKRVLGSIYSKYKYQNSVLFYYQTLKKKTIDSLKFYYVTQLKNKIALIKLVKYRKVLYSKAYLFKCQMKLFKRVYFKQKKILLIYRTFFGKVAIRKVSNEEKNSRNMKAINYFRSILKAKAIKGLSNYKQSIIKLNASLNQLYLNKLKNKAMNEILNHHLLIKQQSERLKKYNRINYAFLEIISNRYIKVGYSLIIKSNRELLLAFIALLKNNNLKVLYTATKFARLAIVKMQKAKIIKNRQLRCQKQFKINQKRTEIKNVYCIFAYRLLNSKIYHNKIMIINCIIKQKTIQSFFSNLANILSTKLKLIQFHQIWKISQIKFRLFELLSSLFLSKTLNETKVKSTKVTSSFEIVSLRLLTKKRQKMIQSLLEQNIFNKFIQGVKMLKSNRIINFKKHIIIKTHKKTIYSQYIVQQKKKSLLKKKQRQFQLNSIRKLYHLTKRKIQFNKWINAATLSRQDKLKHNSLIVFYHYSKFKTEKTFRDNHFKYNLIKRIKDYSLNKYFIKSTVLLKCIKVAKIIQETNQKKRVLAFIRKRIAKSSVREIIQYYQLIKYIQLMLQVAFSKKCLIDQTNCIQKNTYSRKILAFIRTIRMRKNVQRHYITKIKHFNIKKTIQKISSVIKCKYIDNYLFTKFYYHCLIYHFCKKNKQKEGLEKKSFQLLRRVPYIYFKSILTQNKTIRFLSSNYYSYIINKIILKPAKISKLLKSLFPMVKCNEIINRFYFMRQLKYLYFANKVCNKRRAIAIKSFIHNQIFNNKYTITINKLVKLFNIKHNLKHFMIIVLSKIKHELIIGKQKGLLLKKSLKQLKLKDKRRAKIKHHLNNLKETFQVSQKINKLFLFFHLINRKRRVTKIKSNTLMLLNQNKYKEYILFFNTINILFQSQKKARLLHIKYLKDIKERLIDKIKYRIILLKQSSFLSFKNSYRHFLIYSINHINNKALIVRKQKFIHIKYLRQLYSLVQNKVSSTRIKSSQSKYISLIRHRRLKQYYIIFIKKILFNQKEKKKLKRQLFEMLKQNCVVSQDINYYLNQAEALMA